MRRLGRLRQRRPARPGRRLPARPQPLLPQQGRRHASRTPPTQIGLTQRIFNTPGGGAWSTSTTTACSTWSSTTRARTRPCCSAIPAMRPANMHAADAAARQATASSAAGCGCSTRTASCCAVARHLRRRRPRRPAVAAGRASRSSRARTSVEVRVQLGRAAAAQGRSPSPSAREDVDDADAVMCIERRASRLARTLRRPQARSGQLRPKDCIMRSLRCILAAVRLLPPRLRRRAVVHLPRQPAAHRQHRRQGRPGDAEGALGPQVEGPLHRLAGAGRRTGCSSPASAPSIGPTCICLARSNPKKLVEPVWTQDDAVPEAADRQLARRRRRQAHLRRRHAPDRRRRAALPAGRRRPAALAAARARQARPPGRLADRRRRQASTSAAARPASCASTSTRSRSTARRCDLAADRKDASTEKWKELQAKYEEDKKKDPDFAVPPTEDQLPKADADASSGSRARRSGTSMPRSPSSATRCWSRSAFLDKEKVGDRALYCLDATTGKALWRSAADAQPLGRAVGRRRHRRRHRQQHRLRPQGAQGRQGRRRRASTWPTARRSGTRTCPAASSACAALADGTGRRHRDRRQGARLRPGKTASGAGSTTPRRRSSPRRPSPATWSTRRPEGRRPRHRPEDGRGEVDARPGRRPGGARRPA